MVGGATTKWNVLNAIIILQLFLMLMARLIGGMNSRIIYIIPALHLHIADFADRSWIGDLHRGTMSDDSIFAKWAESCEKDGIELRKLDSNDSAELSGLYMTKRPYEVNGKTFYYEPVYHVWVDGKWSMATTNYQEAVRAWEERRNDK